MSAGHWQYVGASLRDELEMIGTDERARARWPRITDFCVALAPILYDAEHEMDWDLSSDTHIADDEAFQDVVCHAILEAAMQGAADRLFPRGKWATFQAVQGRTTTAGACDSVRLVTLRAAAAVVRTHDPRRGVPSSESNVNVHFGAAMEEIAREIEALGE